jgi:SulP family sulfate permease
VVALALRGKPDLGSTFIAVLQRYARALQARGGRFMLVGVDPAARDQLARTGTLEIIGAENVFLATEQLGASVNQAAAAARAWLGQSPSGETR